MFRRQPWATLPLAGVAPYQAMQPVRMWPGRWWTAGSLIVLVLLASYVAKHDPTPGLSPRSWATIGLAVLLVVLVGRHRTIGLGLLAGRLVEYGLVALLAGLLTTTAAGPPVQHA